LTEATEIQIQHLTALDSRHVGLQALNTFSQFLEMPNDFVVRKLQLSSSSSYLEKVTTCESSLASSDSSQFSNSQLSPQSGFPFKY
jgi:hypothetical protein